MNSLSRSKSRQVWRCQICHFDNSILLKQCQICEHEKLSTDIKQEKKSQKKQTHLFQKIKQQFLICVDPKCKTQNDLNQIKCIKCDKFLIEQLNQDDDQYKPQKIEEKQLDLMKCHSCGFQNSISNVTCLSCEVRLRKKRLPRKYKPLAPRSKGPNFCNQCQSYRTGQFGGQMECKCPDPDDGVPVKKLFCNYCFENLEDGKYNIHTDKCNQKQKFFDRNKNQSYQRCSRLQIDTIMYMHRKSETIHFGKQKKLQKRIQKLGYSIKDLQNLYHYIVNYAPIIIHMHSDKHMQFFVKDTHYRNQFQTAVSSGSLSHSARTNWQDRMFDKMHHSASPFQRVKYGTMNFTNDPSGVSACLGYGQSYFLLKSHVRDRCTMTDMDSSSSNSTICTFRFCYHLLAKLTDVQIKAAFQGSKAQQVKSAGIIGVYKEIQIHGPVQFKKDIERVYIHRAELKSNPEVESMTNLFCKNNDLQYQIFGEQPKPHPPGGFAFGGFGGYSMPAATGSLILGPSDPSFYAPGGVFGAPLAYKSAPRKLTAVSFPYSSKDIKKKDGQDYI